MLKVLPPILKYGFISLWSVKYANLAGGKKLSTSKNFGQVKFDDKIFSRDIDQKFKHIICPPPQKMMLKGLNVQGMYDFL